MSTNTLIPDYMDIDFNTAKSTLKTLLAANPVFKDVDYEGANITVMIELISYLIALNTYYMNQIARNQFIPTSNMYETTHMLSQLGGYSPMGYRSSSTTLGVAIDISASQLELQSLSASESVIINEWSEISNSLGITNPDTGSIIKFVTVDPTSSYAISAMAASASALGTNTYTIPVVAREGHIVRYDYVGSDISDNRLYIPMDTYDYDDDLDDTHETIKVYVDDVKWTRLSDWFESSADISNAYMFKYDKYGRYYIEFSSTRNVPTTISVLNVFAIVSSGGNGNVAAGIVNLPNSTFLERELGSGGADYLPITCYTISNSAASIGGSSPESIDEIKNSTLGVLHSQYRNVTKNDYISHLESRADIVQANVWGEQEQNPSGSVQDYNKVYISLVPSEWNTSTITYEQPSASTSTPISATGYNEDFTLNISEYLKPRKILTVYEEYVVPELLYFKFSIGLKIKPNYTYTSVKADVEDKLRFYFDSYNRTFNERISFIDITEYILDTTITSSTKTFSQVKGLKALVMRDVDVVVYSPTDPYYTSRTPNEYDSNDIQYPYYVEANDEFSGNDNKLRTIQLGHNQFPMVYIPNDTFHLEI